MRQCELCSPRRMGRLSSLSALFKPGAGAVRSRCRPAHLPQRPLPRGNFPGFSIPRPGTKSPHHDALGPGVVDGSGAAGRRGLAWGHCDM